jgi:hypothetical protein
MGPVLLSLNAKKQTEAIGTLQRSLSHDDNPIAVSALTVGTATVCTRGRVFVPKRDP